jgi:hypothetical protein
VRSPGHAVRDWTTDTTEDVTMDLGKITDKAKDWAGTNPEKADGVVEKGEGFADSHFAGHEQQVDMAGEKAKDFLHGDQAPEGQQPPPPGEPQPGEQPPPPPPQP